MPYCNLVKILMVCMCNAFFLSAQDIITVTNITSSSEIYKTISPDMARSNALNDAKIEALKRAGIAESIKNYGILYNADVSGNRSQFFSQETFSELNGAVVSYTIISEGTSISKPQKISYTLTLNAQVIKYNSKPDPNFTQSIKGIEAVYKDKSHITFEITSSQKAYVTIFNISEHEQSVLFPNAEEASRPLWPNTPLQFPILKKIKLEQGLQDQFKPEMEYEYTISKSGANKEVNRLIFVFTKEPTTFVKYNIDAQGNTTITNQDVIYNWIYQFQPHQRNVEVFTFSIYK